MLPQRPQFHLQLDELQQQRGHDRISRLKAPTRSPLADVSPNHSRGQSPKRSPLKSPLDCQGSSLSQWNVLIKEAAGMQTEQADKRKDKLILPSLGKPVPTIFSSEIPSGFHVRSPAPTTNSQRREMKRLHASLPSISRLHESTIGRNPIDKQLR
jgi:hypothetical protein